MGHKLKKNEILVLKSETMKQQNEILNLRKSVANAAKESERKLNCQSISKQKYGKILSAKKDIERKLKMKAKELKEMKEIKVLHEKEVGKHEKLKKKYEKKKEMLQSIKTEKEKIENKFEELKKKYDDLKKDNVDWEKERANLKIQLEKCDNLRGKYDNLVKERDDLARECKLLEHDKDDIIFDLNEMQQFSEEMVTNYECLKEKYDLQKEKIQTMQCEMLIQQQSNDEMIKLQHKNQILQIKTKKIQNDYWNLQKKYNEQRETFGFLEWTTKDVANFIVNIDYRKYCHYYDHLLENLLHEGVDGECLHNLDKDDLHRFGIVHFKDKQNILNKIKDLVRNKSKDKKKHTNKERYASKQMTCGQTTGVTDGNYEIHPKQSPDLDASVSSCKVTFLSTSSSSD